ncbi:ABC transporter permease [Oleiharenicola lentus]|uniref:ABC transporter permease n=1 Tax=Oleiharenicola lentus TaxID=2508720 RepID=UPI003F678C97
MNDLRLALRLLLRDRGFSFLAILVLCLGIGGVTTMFSVVNAVLLRGLPFARQDRLMDVNFIDPASATPNFFSPRQALIDFDELEAAKPKSFQSLAAYLSFSTVNLSWQSEARRYNGGYVTHNYFSTLGAKPALGRDFTPDDDRPGATHAVLLSDSLWRADFGADPHVIGRTVRVNGKPAVIIGVMPRGFVFPFKEQLWLPIRAEFGGKTRTDNNQTFVSVAARLSDGVTIEQAQQEIAGLAKQFSVAYRATNGAFSSALVRPLLVLAIPAGFSPLLWTMLAFCVGVLVLACVNVMNMQFARAISRGREFAIRSSLGASVSRLVRQMLAESLLLAAIGALLGVGIAFWAVDALQAFMLTLPNSLPEWMRFEVNLQVLGVVIGTTAISAVLSAIIPALLASRGAAASTLKESGRGLTGRSVIRWMRGLVVFQIFVTCVLLVAALLQARSIYRQSTQDYGFKPDAVITARIGLMAGIYPTPKSRQVFYEKLQHELRTSPELEASALSSRIRSILGGQSNIEIEGSDYPNDTDRTIAQFENITPDYSATIGQRLLEGRFFKDEDSDQRRPLAIVNTTFAKKHFGNESAVGRRFRTANPDGSGGGPWREIVGVVSDVRMLGPQANVLDNAGYYVPFFDAAVGPAATTVRALQFATIVARPRGGQSGEAALDAVRAALRRVDADLPPYFVETPATSFSIFLGQNQLVATLFVIFGAVATVLAAAGLYGVTSFAVNQRTREFGVRVALGALPRQILDLVLRQSAAQLAAGVALGVLLAVITAVLARDAIAGSLFETSPLDPLIYGAVIGLLIVVSLVATFVPARRATKTDPMVALRSE